MKNQRSGFTLIEIVIGITIIGILASLVYTLVIPKSRERAYYSRSLSEMNSMSNALNLYVAKYNDYPPEVERNIPAGIKEFIQSQKGNDEWPDAPYPGAVYDYENWPAGPNGNQTYQISIRFCADGDSATCKAKAKQYLSDYVSDETLNNWDSRSSMYFCIKGDCRSHNDLPKTHAGFCVNCGKKGHTF